MQVSASTNGEEFQFSFLVTSSPGAGAPHSSRAVACQEATFTFVLSTDNSGKGCEIGEVMSFFFYH